MKKVIVQRHGKYTAGNPQGTEEEKSVLGHLTPEGIEDVMKRTQERLNALGNVKDVAFLIVYSPTYWHDNPNLGQRAYETAQHIEATILKNGGNVVGMRADFRLGEAVMFQTPFAGFLRNECGGQGAAFWKAFEQDVYADERQKCGAEGPKDIARRIFLAVNNTLDFLRNCDGPTVAWIVTHGDCTAPYGAFLDISSEIPSGYNDGFEIHLRDEELVAIVDGEEYKL